MHTALQSPSRASWTPSSADWPFDAMQAFSLRMAQHGHCVSSRLMVGSRAYALEQLAHAHALGDGSLSEMALALFRHFERQRSGIAYA